MAGGIHSSAELDPSGEKRKTWAEVVEPALVQEKYQGGNTLMNQH